MYLNIAALIRKIYCRYLLINNDSKSNPEVQNQDTEQEQKHTMQSEIVLTVLAIVRQSYS